MMLRARPDLVVIDPDLGPLLGKAEIQYQGGPGSPAHLWYRTLDATSGPPDLTWLRKELEPPDHLSGHFDTIVSPGQVYQVRLYTGAEGAKVDPNHPTKIQPDAEVSVIGLLKAPGPADLIASTDHSAGGTWYQMSVTTYQPTFARLEVSQGSPVVGADGILRFERVLHTVFDETGDIFKLHHDLLVESRGESLLPGHVFHAILRVWDEYGNWDGRHRSFRTKRRHVVVNFDEVHIINDGSFGDTEGSFKIWVEDGFQKLLACEFGDENFPISDSPDPGHEHEEHIPLAPPRCNQFALGPQRVRPTDPWVGVFTRGLAHNAGAADPATSVFAPAFRVPVGKDKEVVTDEPHEVVAIPDDPDNDEFSYALKVRYSIKYVAW